MSADATRWRCAVCGALWVESGTNRMERAPESPRTQTCNERDGEPCRELRTQ